MTSEMQPEAGRPARRVYSSDIRRYAGDHTGGSPAIDSAALSERGISLLGLANQLLISPEERMACIQTYRATLDERYADVERKWQSARTPITPMAGVVDDLFDHSLKMIAAEMAWLDDWIERHRRDGKENEVERKDDNGR